MFTARRATAFMAAGALLTLLTVGGWQFAERVFAAPSGVISGCYQTPAQGNRDDRGRGDDRKSSDENTGALRIVGGASDCRKNETFIQWSQVGPKGDTGAAGPQGLKGDKGDTGAPGAPGTGGGGITSFDSLNGTACSVSSDIPGVVRLSYLYGSGAYPVARFECIPTARFTMTVNGNGTVVGQPPVSGINCPGTCSSDVPVQTAVSFLMTAAPGWVFSGMTASGGGGGTPSCGPQVPVTSCGVSSGIGTTALTATFVPGVPLTVQVSGTGRVSSVPAGIENCAATCTMLFVSGTQVQLSATGTADSVLTAWGGACPPGASSTCLWTANAPATATATFTSGTLLTVLPALVSESYVVTSTPAGISCSFSPTSKPPCAALFTPGTQVTLSMSVPPTTWSTWYDCDTVTPTSCTVTLTSSRIVSVFR